jgi:hypothetical protein
MLGRAGCDGGQCACGLVEGSQFPPGADTGHPDPRRRRAPVLHGMRRSQMVPSGRVLRTGGDVRICGNEQPAGSRAACRPLLRFVRLSTERARPEVRQACSFAKKQASVSPCVHGRRPERARDQRRHWLPLAEAKPAPPRSAFGAAQVPRHRWGEAGGGVKAILTSDCADASPIATAGSDAVWVSRWPVRRVPISTAALRCNLARVSLVSGGLRRGWDAREQALGSRRGSSRLSAIPGRIKPTARAGSPSSRR